MLKKRSPTSTVVPVGEATGRGSSISPAVAVTSVPAGCSGVRVIIRSLLTAAMLASASPRKPSVRMS